MAAQATALFMTVTKIGVFVRVANGVGVRCLECHERRNQTHSYDQGLTPPCYLQNIGLWAQHCMDCQQSLIEGSLPTSPDLFQAYMESKRP